MAHRLSLVDQPHYVGERRSVPKHLEHSRGPLGEERHHGSNLDEEAQMTSQGGRRARHSGRGGVERECPEGWHNPWQLDGSPVPASW